MANYTIDINFNDKSSGEEEKGYKSSFSTPDMIDETASNSFGQLVKGVKAFAPAVLGAKLVKTVFDWQISLVDRYTGSQQAQNRANAIMKIVATAGGALLSFSNVKEIDENSYERKWENIGNAIGIERAGASYNRSRTG